MKRSKTILASLLGLKRAIGPKLVLVVRLTNLWCLMTKSTTLEILLDLNHKEEIKKIKNQTCVSLSLKRAIGLITCFGGAFDKLLVFVDQKTTLEILLALKHKKEITKIKNQTSVL